MSLLYTHLLLSLPLPQLLIPFFALHLSLLLFPTIPLIEPVSFAFVSFNPASLLFLCTSLYRQRTFVQIEAERKEAKQLNIYNSHGNLIAEASSLQRILLPPTRRSLQIWGIASSLWTHTNIPIHITIRGAHHAHIHTVHAFIVHTRFVVNWIVSIREMEKETGPCSKRCLWRVPTELLLP